MCKFKTLIEEIKKILLDCKICLWDQAIEMIEMLLRNCKKMKK